MAKKKATAPRKRSGKKTIKRIRRRRRGLSAGNIPFVGSVSLHNPIFGGAAGAAIGLALKNMIPDDLFGGKTTQGSGLDKIQPYIKGGLIIAAAMIAKANKQPEIAAGLMAVGTALTLQKLQIPGLSDGVDRVRYVNPGLLSDTALLSENIYPDYMPLYETSMLSDRY